jgi:diacylglycerol kinase (ATP)
MKNSFVFAFRGLCYCIKNERNFRFHMVTAFYVLLAAFVTRLEAAEWIALLICISAVIGAEMLNTAIEELCNTLHPGRSDGIGHVKDMTAGAVLFFAVASAVVGGIIFFNEEKIMRTAAFAGSHIFLSILILISVPFAALFVFRRNGHDHKISHDHHRRAAKRR